MEGTKLIPAVGYVRMSTSQQDASPEQQRAEIKKLAKGRYSVVRWYEDHGISGDATEKRFEFQRMIADAEELRDFEVILCWDTDRFGRFDSIEAGKWISPLRTAGVRLETTAQGAINWNDFAGRLMFAIQQEGSKEFLIKLSKNVVRGKIDSAKRGHPQGVTPLGYDRAYFDAAGKEVFRVPCGEKFCKPKDWTAKLVPSIQSADTVRWIFETFATMDCGILTIARELNDKGIKTPRGRQWADTSLKHVLTNRAYLGEITVGTRQRGKYSRIDENGDLANAAGTAKRVAPLRAEATHEPIIDRDTFDRVQAKLNDRRRPNLRPRKSDFILTGVLQCGHCGGSMCGEGTRERNRYYRCRANKSVSGSCVARGTRADDLERFIVEKIQQRFFEPEALARLKEELGRQAVQRKTRTVDSRAVKKRIAELGRDIEKGTRNLLLMDESGIAGASAILAEWRAEQARLSLEINQTAMQSKASRDTAQSLAERALAKLGRLSEDFHTADPMRLRGVVREVVDHVSLFWEPINKRQYRVARGHIVYVQNRETRRRCAPD